MWKRILSAYDSELIKKQLEIWQKAIAQQKKEKV